MLPVFRRLMETQLLLWLLGVLFIVLGFAGLVVPMLPGIPLVFAGLVLLAWAENFVYVGGLTLGLLGVLALLSYGVDFLASALGARRFGASSRAIWGAALGAVVGVFFGLPGIVLGPFVGAVAGLVFGALLKIALAFTMVGVFAIDRLL